MQNYALLAVLALALTMATAQAQTFTTLKSFGILTNVTGTVPQSTLVQGPDGTLYGTASYGEGSVAGTVFKIQPDGSGFSVLKLFTNSIEGGSPEAGLMLSGSVLYGTTVSGGSSNLGTVFQLNTNGTGYTVLKNFTGTDGANPYASLTLSGGVLYGTAWGHVGPGTVFQLNTDGTGYTVLYNFTGTPDGESPSCVLTLSGGVLYGTTRFGGSFNGGTVFQLNTDGTGYSVLHNFAGSPDGAYLRAGLTLSGSVLYGTTVVGGSSNLGTVFQVNTDGNGYTVLKSFTGLDGAGPDAALTLSNHVLYGTTAGGGPLGDGTVFSISLSAPPPQVTIAPDGSGGYFIGVHGTPNLTYSLQRAHNLPGPWNTRAPQTADVSGLVLFHDLFPPPDHSFYRALQE